MALQASGQMSFADVYNEITGESLTNPPISITLAELGQLQNSTGQTIALNQNSPYKPDGILPTVFPDEWYRYCQTCGAPRPFLQISKAATPNPNAGEDFNFAITITNNGETPTSGDIYIYDTIPNNIIIRSVTGSNMYYTVTNQDVKITYFGTLGLGQSATFFIIVRSFYSGTYYNQASVNGGGDLTTRFSNTTTTVISTASYTVTVTERRDRTVQRNDCGDFGTGSFVQVFSPFFTTTYTSFISQQDAETQARNESVRLANNWLDANAQAVANAQGSCGFVYPNLQLVQSLSPTTINRFQITTLNINIRNFTTFTSGTITLTCALPAGLNYASLQNAPSGWSFSVNNNTITMTTTQQLSPDYNADFRFSLTGVQTGTFSFFTFGTGGNIANPPVNSNSSTITINQEAVYSIDAGSFNNDYVYNGNFAGTGTGFDAYVNAVPGDDAGHFILFTVNNGNTGTDTVRVEAILPPHIPSNYVTRIFNSTYFDSNIFPTQPNVVVFTNKTTVPAGQYVFQVKYNLPLEFYSISTLKSLNPNNNNSTLTVFESGQNVSCLQQATFYLFINNGFVNQKSTSIRWFNNYRFRYEIRLQRNPFFDGTSNVKLYLRQVPSSGGFYTEFIDSPFVPIWNETVVKTILYKDSTRGTDYVPVEIRPAVPPPQVPSPAFQFEYYFYLPPVGGYKQQIDSDIQYSGNLEVFGGSFNLSSIFRYNKNGITDLNNSGNLTQKAYNITTILFVGEDGKFLVRNRTV
jgi:uncharacterized repeat protein (TIGR01451 family)